MVSRWNYLAITAVMLVVFFLFQFTNVALESWDGYEENSYYQDRESLPDKSSVYEAGTELSNGRDDAGFFEDNSREQVIYIGAAEGKEKEVVQTWITYTKRNIACYETLGEYKKEKRASKAADPKMIVVNSGDIDWDQKNLLKDFEKYVDDGVNLIFCGLPDVSVVKDNARLQKLLGIEEIKAEETSVEGVYLREGFFLGGEALYQAEDEEESVKRQDMDLSFPWYALGKSATTYMRGVTEKLLEEEEDYPAIIWRNSFDKACVFAVNGRYMEDVTGMGILTAMTAKMNEYEIYPVVNAQNMIVTNYPGFTSENNAEMKKHYGQSMAEMFRNIAWPSIVAVYRQNTMGLTCMLAPQYDYEDDHFPKQTELQYYMRRLKEQSAEAGLSGENMSETDVRRKLTEDQRFLEKELSDYQFSSFYAGSLNGQELDLSLQEDILESVRTVVTDYTGENEVIGYQTKNITRQSALFDGTKYTYRDDFRMRSLQTALAYSSVKLDMSRVAFPENEEDTLEKVVSEFGGNINYYWDDFKGFAGTTVSECDSRIRSFLALDYMDTREENIIHLKLADPQTPVWFVLRTESGRVADVDGGNAEWLEEGAWLIEAESADVKIVLE